jgi:hypothetical protein
MDTKNTRKATIRITWKAKIIDPVISFVNLVPFVIFVIEPWAVIGSAVRP